MNMTQALLLLGLAPKIWIMIFISSHKKVSGCRGKMQSWLKIQSPIKMVKCLSWIQTSLIWLYYKPLSLDSIAFLTSLQSLVANIGSLVASLLLMLIVKLIFLANGFDFPIKRWYSIVKNKSFWNFKHTVWPLPSCSVGVGTFGMGLNSAKGKIGWSIKIIFSLELRMIQTSCCSLQIFPMRFSSL